MPTPRDLDLMRLHDDDVDDAERARLEAALADPAVRQRFEAFAHVDEAVAGRHELAADEPRLQARFDRMWDELDKRLDLAATEAAPPARAPAPPAEGWWARLGRLLDQYRGHVVTGVVSAGAVAALALLLRPAPPSPGGAPPAPVAAETPRPPPPGPTVDPAAPGPVVPVTALPAEVESLDVAQGKGTVFTIDDEDGERTTVIWVNPDDTVEGI